MISQTCQSIHDIKRTRKQLGFHKTSNSSERTTSCSSQRGHSNLHPDTGDEDDRDDNMKTSNSSTSSSVGGTCNPDTPAHRGPMSPAPAPTLTSRSPSPGRDLCSPPPDNEEDSLPASGGTEQDPRVRMFDVHRVTASCSWSSIQRCTLGDLKNNQEEDSTSESRLSGPLYTLQSSRHERSSALSI